MKRICRLPMIRAAADAALAAASLSSVIAVTGVAALLVTLVLLPATARAAVQQGGGTLAPSAGTAATAGKGMRPAADVLARIGQIAGVVVVADSTVSASVPAALSVGTTPDNVEQKIAEVLQSLSASASAKTEGTRAGGTKIVKMYLPAPAAGRSLNGDTVAEYAYAQKKLFGTTGGESPAGEIEVMGQRVGAEKTKELIAILNLKPVYLVTNPNLRVASSPLGEAMTELSRWTQMSPQEQRQYAQQRAEQFLSMDPALQQQMFQQQRAIIGAVWLALPEDQRQQFFPSQR